MAFSVFKVYNILIYKHLQIVIIYPPNTSFATKTCTIYHLESTISREKSYHGS